MGCCSSSLVDQDYLTTTSEHSQHSHTRHDNNTLASIPLPGVYYNKSRPFKRLGLMWTSDTPISITQLEQKRYLYWETAPTYGGRIEIWQALQVAFSESDVIMARSILEAANVLLPTGNPCEGCFDELGNEYTIPIYCVVPPTNLVLTEDDDENAYTFTNVSLQGDKTDLNDASFIRQSIYSSTNQSDNLVPAPDCSLNPFSVTVRLSTDKDIKLSISSNNETIGSLRTRIFESNESDINKDQHVLRLIFLGRMLKDSMLIICEDVEEIDSELTFSQRGAIRIAKDCVIQALVATKKQS